MDEASRNEDRPLRFETEDGVEVLVRGDTNRMNLARQVIEHRKKLSTKAIRLLETFMRDQGEFDLSTIEIFDDVSRR